MIVTTEGLVTRREAARIAGVHYNTIRLWERSGRLTPRKLPNGDVMIDRGQLEAVLRDRKEGDTSDDPRVQVLEAEVKLLSEERDRLLAELEQARTRHDKLVDKITDIATGP